MNSTRTDLIDRLKRALSKGRKTTTQLVALVGAKAGYISREMRMRPATFVCVQESGGRHHPAIWEVRTT